MNTATLESQDSQESQLIYRSVHTGAVLGVILGLISVVVLLSASGANLEMTFGLAIIPVLGIAASAVALRAIAKSPDVYAGAPLAKTGLALSLLFLVTGVGYSGFIYATEKPDGYTRTSFLSMKPTEDDRLSQRFLTPDAVDFIESKEPIFIKGYIRPDSIRFTKNINEFLLVRDNQECCFGDLSKVQYYDQIKVSLDTGMTTDYSTKLFKLGGVLSVGPADPTVGTPITFYLDADYCK